MAAATNTKQKQQQQPPPAAGQPVVVDPKFEWAEKAGGYVLRITLQGFRKGDFRVQVDGAGRLTVSGARPGATPGSLHKVFQLPATASLDDIAGRFEAGVLTLTVPKRPSSGVPAPTSVEEINKDKPDVAKHDGASATTTTVTPPPCKDVEDNGEKKAASGMKPKEEIGKAVLEKKATACSGWKERVAGGLEQLTDMKWADNVVEKARNNKEVVAIAIAAFSLGFFVSQKLFRK